MISNRNKGDPVQGRWRYLVRLEYDFVHFEGTANQIWEYDIRQTIFSSRSDIKMTIFERIDIIKSVESTRLCSFK